MKNQVNNLPRLPISKKRFIKLCEAFLIFSARTGVKVSITIEPSDAVDEEE